jgi:hypothetical protein
VLSSSLSVSSIHPQRPPITTLTPLSALACMQDLVLYEVYLVILLFNG